MSRNCIDAAAALHSVDVSCLDISLAFGKFRSNSGKLHSFLPRDITIGLGTRFMAVSVT